MTVTLHVCVTCRAGQSVADGAETPGARLLEAIKVQGALPGITIKPVECLSACSYGCSIALSAPDRWSYVYGRLTETDADAIRAGATAYAEAADGIVPWRQRPEIFRKQSISRLPPITSNPESTE